MPKIILKGTPASIGVIEGKVKVVNDPYTHNFKKGDILVTEMTNPRFVLLIHKAAAIITDIGGQLCHAAITAREFKIPCIVGTENATTVLKNGQKVIVNATEGNVYETK